MSTFLMEYLRGCWVDIYNILRIKSHKINSQHCPFYHNCVTNNAHSLLPEPSLYTTNIIFHEASLHPGCSYSYFYNYRKWVHTQYIVRYGLFHLSVPPNKLT